MSKTKRFHFLGKWKNGDPMNVCAYGKDKRSAFYSVLKARKQGKFKYRKGDNFHLEYKTTEETGSIHGHTQYIVDEKGNVEIN